MSHAQSTSAVPGPDETFAVDANAESLRYLQDGFKTYGDIWSIPPRADGDSALVGADQPQWVVNEPDAIHHILTKRQPDYGKGIGFERVKMLLGDGLIVSDGEHWKKRRRMLQPAFSRQSIAAMGATIGQCIASREHVWEEHADNGEPLDMSEEANRLGLRVILRTIFGDELDTLDAREGGNPFNMIVDTQVRDLMFAMRFRQLWPVVRELVEARKAKAGDGVERHDFLGLYMAARDKDSGEPLDMTGLTDEIMTLLIAGHETTAATITWAWSLLSRHPDVQRELQDEVARAGANSDDAPRFDLAPRIVHETLRLYPPVWIFTRCALVDDVLAGHPIRKGTQILFTPYILHRHPRYWERPEEFDPTRIPASGVAPVRGAYIPFSAGPRRCAGDGFALNMAVQHLAWVASRYHLDAPSPGPPALDPGVNLRPLDPIQLGVTRK